MSIKIPSVVIKAYHGVGRYPIEIRTDLKLKGFPTIMLFEDGVETGRQTGSVRASKEVS